MPSQVCELLKGAALEVQGHGLVERDFGELHVRAVRFLQIAGQRRKS